MTAGDRSVVEWTGGIHALPTVDTVKRSVNRLVTAIDGLATVCSMLNKRLADVERRLDAMNEQKRERKELG